MRQVLPRHSRARAGRRGGSHATRSTAPGLAAACLLVGLACAAATARAETEVDPGSDRWAPSATLRGGVVIQTGAAFVQSFLANGSELRPRNTGRQTQIWPLLGGDLELMAPAIDLVPGAPRFFARGGASYSFAPDKNVAKEGNPMNFEFPLPPTAIQVLGRGSATNIQLRSPVWDAGLGAAFEFEAWERNVRLRVSAEYMRERIKLRGKVHEARDFLGTVVPFQIRDHKIESFDAVGGGVGIEFDAVRAGDFVTSVLGEGRAYAWVGDRLLRVRGRDPVFNASALWRYKLDPVAYRLHLGFRIRWQPE